jgi:Peptidase family M28
MLKSRVNLALIIAVTLFLIPPIPSEQTSPPSPAQDTRTGIEVLESIQSNIMALCSPKLQGRRTGTPGAKNAAWLIASRMDKKGLAPLPGTEELLLKFSEGQNVAGLITGSNTKYKRQYIVISCEYDHLGEHKDNDYFQGAADNAVSVAVLLDLAQYFSASPPQRSVILVAWDGSQSNQSGANHFLRELPVPQDSIVAAVHLGTLGRPFYGFMQGVVWAVGTEYSHEMQKVIDNATSQTGLHVLPIADSVLEMKTAHTLFIEEGIPSLLFTTGPHVDYHLPGDIPTKLDYSSILRFSRYMRSICDLLCRTTFAPRIRPSPGCYSSEFRSYAVECGVLKNLASRDMLHFELPDGGLEQLESTRALCRRLCEEEEINSMEGESAREKMRAMHREINKQQRDGRMAYSQRLRASNPTIKPTTPETEEKAPSTGAQKQSKETLSPFAPDEAVVDKLLPVQELYVVAEGYKIPTDAIVVIDMPTSPKPPSPIAATKAVQVLKTEESTSEKKIRTPTKKTKKKLKKKNYLHPPQWLMKRDNPK